VSFTVESTSDTILGMGRAGKALKQVLETYGISQNQVAVKMGIGRSNIYRWVHEVRDPGAEMVIQLRDALHQINPTAAEEFVQLYLGNPPGDGDEK
jgi:transcriptional regulator with XRE-family HTH domain